MGTIKLLPNNNQPTNQPFTFFHPLHCIMSSINHLFLIYSWQKNNILKKFFGLFYAWANELVQENSDDILK